MRRAVTILTATVLTLVTALVLNSVVPAYADTTVVVHGLDWPAPDEETGEWDGGGWTTFTAGRCSDFTQPNPYRYQRRTTYSDDWDAKLGERVQGFLVDPADVDGAVGPVAFTETPSTSTFSMRVKPAAGTTAEGRLVAIYVPPGPAQDYFMGVAPVTQPTPGWDTVSGTRASFTWHQYAAHTRQWGPPDVGPGTGTLASFVATHGGDGTGPLDGYALLGMAFGCNGSSYLFDDLRVGPPEEQTSYDFEGTLADTLLSSSSAKTVTAGREVTLSGAPRDRLRQVDLTLEARPFGADDFTAVGNAPSIYDESSDTQGWASLKVVPQVRTEYRWVMPEGGIGEERTSAVRVVKVRTAVTAKLKDGSLAKRDNLVVTGRTTPRKAGVATTLERYVGGAWRKIDTGRTRKDGTYQFRTPVGTTGTWKVRVRVAAAEGNEVGWSPARTAKVR